MGSTDHSPMSRLATRRALAVIIAVGLGPLVAGLIVFVYALGMVFFAFDNPPQTVGVALTKAAELFGISIIGAYSIGGIVALIAGLLIALWMKWSPPRLSIVLAAVAVAIVAKFAVTEPRAVLLAIVTLPYGRLPIALALGLLAATICWFMMRRFVRPQ